MWRIENSSLLYLASQVEEVRDAMENEMRTQLRRQAAAHTDHLRDVLRVQEQELKYEFEQVRTCRKASSPLQPPFPLYVINSLCFPSNVLHVVQSESVEERGKISNGAYPCWRGTFVYFTPAPFYIKVYLCVTDQMCFVFMS